LRKKGAEFAFEAGKIFFERANLFTHPVAHTLEVARAAQTFQIARGGNGSLGVENCDGAFERVRTGGKRVRILARDGPLDGCKLSRRIREKTADKRA